MALKTIDMLHRHEIKGRTIIVREVSLKSFLTSSVNSNLFSVYIRLSLNQSVIFTGATIVMPVASADGA